MSEQWVLYRDGVPWGYYDSQSEGRAELMEHVRADEDAEWKLEDANISSTQGQVLRCAQDALATLADKQHVEQQNRSFARHSAAQDDKEEDGEHEQTSTDEH